VAATPAMAALQRNIPVIPLLVHGASVPCENDLPASLAQLSYRSGIAVRPIPTSTVPWIVSSPVSKAICPVAPEACDLRWRIRPLGCSRRTAESKTRTLAS
jgi:hypothetical protein